MNDPLYREIILDHWAHPQNYGVLKNPDVDVTQANPLCGDEIRLMAKIKNKKISEITFTSTGCAIAKASASLLTTLVKDVKVSEFCSMTPEEFLQKFEIGFSPARLKCALLSFSTLQKALKETVSLRS